jgi:hypothetical protein
MPTVATFMPYYMTLVIAESTVQEAFWMEDKKKHQAHYYPPDLRSLFKVGNRNQKFLLAFPLP